MSIKLAEGIDLNKQQAEQMAIHNLATAPTSPVGGQIWYNTSDGYLYYRDSQAGVNRQLIHYTQFLATALNQFAAPTAALNLNNQRITNLLDPVNAQDATTKNYVDSLLQGIKWKDAVRVASTTALTKSGIQTIDGVTLSAGDRVADMSTSSGAGIWIVASGAWSRATDADTSAEVLGMSFFVSEGTANGNKLFVCTTDAPLSLGSTALTFAQIGAGTTYSAGTGLTITGNTIAIDTTVVVRKFTALVGNGSLTSITVTHNLGTKNLTSGLRKVSTDEKWWESVTFPTVNTATYTFAVAPTSNEFEVTLHA